MYSTLKGQVETLLGTLAVIQEVATTPKESFAGFPGCYVEAGEVRGEYLSMNENLRTYYFTVKVFYDTEGATVASAFTAMEDLIDDVLDLFDDENQKATAARTIGKSLGTGYTYVNLEPTSVKWDSTQDSRFLQVNFRIGVNISVEVS